MPATSPLFAAIDMGASGARLLAGRLRGGVLQATEVARLGNGPVPLPDGLNWDLLRLYQGMLNGLAQLSCRHDGPLWLGIDGWVVDYGLLDRGGHLLGLPFHYRDARTDGRVAGAEALLGAGLAYEATGIQTMQINTIYQLMAEREGAAYGVASRLLLVPDLVAWLLTGEARREATNASTTQMVDVRNGQPVGWLLDRLGLRTDLLAEPVAAGEVLGPVLAPVADSAGVRAGAQVVAVATHDTASAVLAMPALVEDFAYLVSGSRSLVGLELPAPVVDDRSRAANFSK